MNWTCISQVGNWLAINGNQHNCHRDHHHHCQHHRHHFHHRHHSHHRPDCVNPLVKGSDSPSAALIVSQRRVNPCLSRHPFSPLNRHHQHHRHKQQQQITFPIWSQCKNLNITKMLNIFNAELFLALSNNETSSQRVFCKYAKLGHLGHQLLVGAPSGPSGRLWPVWLRPFHPLGT